MRHAELYNETPLKYICTPPLHSPCTFPLPPHLYSCFKLIQFPPGREIVDQDLPHPLFSLRHAISPPHFPTTFTPSAPLPPTILLYLLNYSPSTFVSSRFRFCSFPFDLFFRSPFFHLISYALFFIHILICMFLYVICMYVRLRMYLCLYLRKYVCFICFVSYDLSDLLYAFSFFFHNFCEAHL